MPKALDLDALEAFVTTTTHQLEELGEQLASLDEFTDILEARIDELDRKLDRLAELDQLERRVGNVEDDVNRLDARVDHVERAS